MAESICAASHDTVRGTGGRAIGALITRSTNEVSVPQRLQFARDDMMRLLEPAESPGAGPAAFHLELNRIQGRHAEFVDLKSDAMAATRSAERCRKDSCDDISFDFMISGSSDMQCGQAVRRVNAGDFAVIDISRPVQMIRSKHRNISLIVRRAQVRGVIKNLSPLTRHEFPARGLMSLLKSHIHATMDHAHELHPHERVMAIDIAVDMMLVIVQGTTFGNFDPEQFQHGFYEAAKSMIARDCANPELTPSDISKALGCSRAALYRAFAGSDETIAALIWSSRVEGAHRMLNSARYDHLPITEIVFRSGFLDHSTFNRMFKRRYDMTADDMRRTVRKRNLQSSGIAI
jgi:AraC-like DNA-binding protein